MPTPSDKSTTTKVNARVLTTQHIDGSLSSSTLSGGDYSFPAVVTYEDVPKRDWRALVRSGRDATTEADGLKMEGKVVRATLRHHWRHSAGLDIVDSSVGAFTPPIGGVAETYSSDLYADALAGFVKQARSVQHRFQAGVFLGELVQTINLLRRPLSIFRTRTQAYHNTVRNRVSRAKPRAVKKILANEYLTYSFGVVPLLGDIDDAMYDLAALSVGKPPSVLVRVARRSRKSYSIPSSTLPYGSTWLRRNEQNAEYSQSVTIRGKVYVMLPTLGWHGNDSVLVALSDFGPTLYELIPYSFLLDYFVNIGDLVSSLCFLSSSVEWCNSTSRSSVSYRSYDYFTYKASPTKFTYSHSESDTKALATETKWRRRRVTNFVPPLSFTIPGASSLKWLNMTALLLQSRSV